MSTDITEKGLETLIVRHMTGTDGLAFPRDQMADRPRPLGGTGYAVGSAHDFDRAHALDLPQLFAFLRATQPEAFAKLALADDTYARDINRLKFLARVSSEVGKRGVIDVLRKGVDHGPVHFDLFYGTPSPGNATAEKLHAENCFSITRQLAYSMDETRRALDLCLFINGLPIATFELKNSLTKQTVEDAVEQYKRDRDPRERLFEFGRCVVHFAVDDSEVRMCTELRGKASWFLPFNKGYDDGAGNPPNPLGLKTDYLWKEALTPEGLTNILENYAQIVEEKDPRTGRKKRRQVWPRYHQLGVVRQALADVRTHGAGKRYLIQHSAGSGKSNSIAWLAHQLIGLKREDKDIFDSVIVVTDRRILDHQIQTTLKQFMQVKATVTITGRLLNSLAERWREGSADREDLVRLLKLLIERGMTPGDHVFLAARQCLLSKPETMDDFQAAAAFCETYSEFVSTEDRDLLKSEFELFAGDYATGWDSDDPDWLRQVASDIEALGETFGVDTEEHTQGLLERADEIETERAQYEPDDDDDDGGWRAETVVDDVQGMFDGLQSDLRDT